MEKVDLSKGYWNPPRKQEVVMHFSEIISLESQQNDGVSIFLKI